MRYVFLCAILVRGTFFLPESAAQEIRLETKMLKLEYKVTAKKILEIERFGARDDSWATPIKGRLFPTAPLAEPHRHNNGPRYLGPIQWGLPNGCLLYTSPSPRDRG